jgi:hypothetical protein
VRTTRSTSTATATTSWRGSTTRPSWSTSGRPRPITHKVAAHHFGYQTKAGSPIVGRNIWFDYDGIALIVDWGQASTTHAYQVSFNLPGTADTVSGVESDGSFRTRYSSGNVKVAPLLRSGQVVARNAPTFISNQPPPDESDPAYRFTITASGTFQVFATLVTTYSGTTAPNVKAEWVTTNPQPGQPIVLRLTKNGVSRDITFAAPVQRPTKYLGSEGGSSNDMAFDGDKLHLAFFDRDTRSLKYTGRAKDGTWTLLQTIDPNMDAGAYVSLAVDSKGLPGVAYYDGNRGDLKFARMQSTGGWSVQTVDSVGEVGLYPSLVFSRTNDPIITYYRKTSGDLRMATTVPGGWQISSVDTTGDVGRFSSLQLDPNFPTVSQISIAYEDTSNGSFKYAVQSGGGWKTMSIDNTTTEGGGYTSLAFEPFRSGDGTFHPGRELLRRRRRRAEIRHIRRRGVSPAGRRVGRQCRPVHEPGLRRRQPREHLLLQQERQPRLPRHPGRRRCLALRAAGPRRPGDQRRAASHRGTGVQHAGRELAAAGGRDLGLIAAALCE